MNDVLLLYLFTRVDTFIGMASTTLGIGSLIYAFSIAFRKIEMDLPPWRPRMCGVIATCLLTIILFVPSQKDLAIIVGGKYALDAVRSPQAAELSGLVMDAVRATLKNATK
jgi:hypothetical protein